MEEIIDLIATDASPAEISDVIKNGLFAKAAERINDLRSAVASSIFDDESSDVGEEE
jgi:hypothetical protein